MRHVAFDYDDVCVPPIRQIGMHSHRCWELSLVTCGAGRRTVGDTTEPFAEGEIVLVPPGMTHQWLFDPGVTDAGGNISNISVFFDSAVPDGLGALLPEMEAAAAALGSLTDAIIYAGGTCARLRELLHAMRGLTPRARLPLMLDLLMTLADTAGCRAVGHDRHLTNAERRFEKVRVYCACNYARSVSLGEMAAHLGMNKSAFCAFMRRHAGTTWSDYLNSVRLDRAAERLTATRDRISAIAYDTGFSNVTYFNRLFRAAHGCSPSEYRKRTFAC